MYFIGSRMIVVVLLHYNDFYMITIIISYNLNDLYILYFTGIYAFKRMS